MTSTDATTLVLMSRHACHLCDEMEAILKRVLPRWGLDYRVVDIDDDPELSMLYDECVPVLLWEGHEVARIRSSERRLQKILRRRLGPAAAGPS